MDRAIQEAYMKHTISDSNSPMTAYETKDELIAILRRSILTRSWYSSILYEYKEPYMLRRDETSAPYFVIRKYRDGWALRIRTRYVRGAPYKVRSGRLTVAQFSDLFRN